MFNPIRISVACLTLTVFGATALAQEAAKDAEAVRIKKLEREMLLVQYGHSDCVVGTIVNAFDNFASPILFVRVDSILRGDPKVSRVRAEWTGPAMPLCGNDKDLGKHLAMTSMWLHLNRPKIGEKWILWGYVAENRMFKISSTTSVRYSKEAEKKANQNIVDADKARAEWEAEQEAQKKKRQAALDAWRGKVTDKDIARLVKQADFVGVGKRVSGWPVYEVTKILKGERRNKYTGTEYYVEFASDKAIEHLIDRETPYLFFLIEKETPKQPKAVAYSPVPGSDGLVIADAAALRAAEAALRP